MAAAIIEGIDERWLPETTEKREPYLHPYIASGDVTKVDLKVLVRAFSNEKLEEREEPSVSRTLWLCCMREPRSTGSA